MSKIIHLFLLFEFFAINTHLLKFSDRERYLRFALRLPHTPPPIIMVTGDGEYRTKDKTETAMLEKYGKYGSNFVYMAGGLLQTGYSFFFSVLQTVFQKLYVSIPLKLCV